MWIAWGQITFKDAGFGLLVYRLNKLVGELGISIICIYHPITISLAALKALRVVFFVPNATHLLTLIATIDNEPSFTTLANCMSQLSLKY